MGVFKQDEANKADKALIDGPAMLVDSRQRVLADIMVTEELFSEPTYETSVSAPLSYRKPYDSADFSWGSDPENLSFSPSTYGTGVTTQAKALTALGKKLTVLHGYNQDQSLYFEYGNIIEMTTPPDLYLSNLFEVSVQIVDLDQNQEIILSNDVDSTMNIDGNTFSTYVGNYYLAQNYETGELYNLDDDLTVYTVPAPYLPKNVVNGEPVQQGTEPNDPTALTDTRYDFYQSNSGITVMDVYVPEQYWETQLNSVSNNLSFIASETLLSKNHTMTVSEVGGMNTETMTVNLNSIGLSNTTDGVAFQPGDYVKGISSGAFGYIGGNEKKFRWSREGEGIFISNTEAIEGYDQEAWSQQYATMNCISYLSPDPGGEYPGKLILYNSLANGCSNTLTGATQNTTNTAHTTFPPILGKTLVLRRHTAHDANTPEHTNALLAIVSGRGMQINYDWYAGNNRHDNSDNTVSTFTTSYDSITKMNQTDWESYLGWFSNTQNEITRSAKRNEYVSSQANTGSGDAVYSSNRSTVRDSEHYHRLEYNPFYPRADDLPDASAPYAGNFVYWDGTLNKDSNGAPQGGVAFAVHSELRWRGLPNPFLSGYDYANAYHQTTHKLVPGYLNSGNANNEVTTLNEIYNLRAPNALDAGFSRLVEGRDDGNQSAGAGQALNDSWKWVTDGDFVTTSSIGPGQTVNGVSTLFFDATADSFVIPGSTSSGNSTYTPYRNADIYNPADPAAGLVVEDHHATISNPSTVWSRNFTANISPATGENSGCGGKNYEAGTYYKISNGKVFVVTASHNGVTPVTQTSTDPTTNTSTTVTLYYRHFLKFTQQEYQTDLNIIYRFLQSNDFTAFRAMRDRLTNPDTTANTSAGDPYSLVGFVDPFYEEFQPNQVNTQSGEALYLHGPSKNIEQNKDAAFGMYVVWLYGRMDEMRVAHQNYRNGYTASTSAQTITMPYTNQEWYEALYRFKFVLGEYINSLRSRIGYPIDNSSGINWNGGAGFSAEGYSQIMYNTVEVLLGDDTGTIPKVQSALKNIGSIYDDVIKNRKKYRTFAEN